MAKRTNKRTRNRGRRVANVPARRKSNKRRSAQRTPTKTRITPRNVSTNPSSKAFAVLARVRHGESLSKAAHDEGIAARTVLKQLGKQFRRTQSGRFTATRGDALRRDILVFSFDGLEPTVARSWKQAQLASKHLIAINQFVNRNGDEELLKPFVGRLIGGIELLTNPDRIRELAGAGLLKVDNLYRQNRGARQEK